MRVTIGIPCYKQAEYLHEAIESALNQTYKDIEIIVVNDGSPDTTRIVAEAYPVKLINQVNKGLASARNTAIMNMTGDYFLPLDADDILLPDCVGKIVEAAESGADVIAPSFQTIGLSVENVILMPNPTIGDFRTFNRIGYFSAIKKEALLEVGGYSPRMEKGWEDYHLWFNLLTRGKKILTLPDILVLYRTKEKSMWRDSVKHSKVLWDQIFKDFPELLPKEIKTL